MLNSNIQRIQYHNNFSLKLNNVLYVQKIRRYKNLHVNNQVVYKNAVLYVCMSLMTVLENNYKCYICKKIN